MCQFLIGNVSQLIYSVSINDTTPFSAQNQYKMVKKSVDLKHHNISKSLIFKGLAICHYSSLTSTDFSAQDQIKYVKIRQFLQNCHQKHTLNPYIHWIFRSTDFFIQFSAHICLPVSFPAIINTAIYFQTIKGIAIIYPLTEHLLHFLVI